MAEPYLGEIKIIGFGFAPVGWARCDGQILPIAQNQSLFSLLGTNYGGDGRTTFGLPDLRGRTPMHKGGGFALGQKSGQEGVPLTEAQLPSHDHPMRASDQAANTAEATGAALAQSAENVYAGSSPAAELSADSVGDTGSGQGHNNMQPFLTLYFIIALTGTFPPRN